MVSTWKERHSNKRVLRQLGSFDHDVLIGNAANNREPNIVVTERTADRKLTVGNSNSKMTPMKML